MLTAHRKTLLLETLRRDGSIVAKELAIELGLSEDTIRRDLRELAAEGLLTRVHGGALPRSPAAQGFEARRTVATDSKLGVAAAASRLVTDGQTIFIDGGTTAQALCRALPVGLRATVITHAPTVAVELMGHRDLDVLLIGGRMYPHSVVAVGALALEQIERVRADVFFMGVSGLHPEAGLTTGDAEEAAIKRAIARRSADTFVLASHEKIGAVSPHRVLPADDVTAVLTDAGADPSVVRALHRAGVDVRVARAPGTRRARR